MRTTVIPAQVTTVEDTIAGNLTLTQIVLLIFPIFLSTAIYATLPEGLAFTAYKIPLMIIVSLFFALLALRIKGRLLLSWVTLLTTYSLRPHLFVFDKNTVFTREVIVSPIKKKLKVLTTAKIKKQTIQVKKGLDYEFLLRNTALNLRFTRKGLLIVKNI